MSREEVIRRADDAARVLNEKVVVDALMSIKQEIIDQWEATPARDAEAREWLWRHYKVAEKFEGILRGCVEAGKMEKAILEQKKSPVERIRAAVGF